MLCFMCVLYIFIKENLIEPKNWVNIDKAQSIHEQKYNSLV